MFFTIKENIPEGLGFGTFSATHIIWLVSILAMIVVCAVVYKKQTARVRNIMRITTAIIVVALEMLKNIVLIIFGEFGVGYLPFHLCGINILLIAFDMFKRTKTVENFLYYFCIPGASLALLFPNWTTVPCMNFFHIHSFLIHAFLVLYPILLLSGGEVQPEVKAMPKCILMLVLMALPLYFLNFLWDTNFMFLKEADTGNPLEFFENLLGNHLWGFPILLPIVMFIMYLPIFVSKKIKVKKTEALNEEKETVTV